MILKNLIVALTIILILRSLWNIAILRDNLKWLFSYKSKHNVIDTDILPMVNICIPVLREQSVISETIKYFSTLNYPKNKFKLFTVTTEKENFEKEVNRKKLFSLAKDLSTDISFDKIINKYLGLFPSVSFEYIYKSFTNKKFELIIDELNKYYDSYPTTYDIISEEIEALNTTETCFIENIHYPYLNKTVTDQFNYAIKNICKSSEDELIVFYNADSRPNLDTLLVVANERLEFEKKHGKKPKVVQQSSIFTLNYNTFKNSLSGYVLKAASIYQTRWTLIHEFYMFRKQSRVATLERNKLKDRIVNNQISHCVAHGLFVDLEHMKSVGGFPSDTLNEDLPFGYYTCCLGESILPIRLIENSHSPETIKSLVNQKKVWFSPYYEYLKCRRNVIKNMKYRDLIEVNIITLQALIIGICWFFQSAIFISIPLYLIFKFDLYILIMYILGLFLYWYLPATIIYNNLYNLEKNVIKEASNTNFMNTQIVILSGLLNIFLNSLGPILCSWEYVMLVVFKKQIIKLKTER